jgi:uncharacterized YccA/Bax inhibitor family protein
MAKAFRRYPDDYPQAPARPFTAAGVYDKVGVLVVLAIATGIYSYITNNTALIVVGAIAGLILYYVGIFKPSTAKYVAPLYALAEGLALGGITAFYASGNTGIIPLAVIFTAGIFLGALVVFRTGLVKVTPRFVTMALMAAIGFIVVGIVAAFGAFGGLNTPTENLVIGAIGVVIGVMFMFVDFSFIQRMEQTQPPLSAEAEWMGAMLLMASLVWVYINVLRILGRRR